jgi:hypothetical protein
MKCEFRPKTKKPTCDELLKKWVKGPKTRTNGGGQSLDPWRLQKHPQNPNFKGFGQVVGVQWTSVAIE